MNWLSFSVRGILTIVMVCGILYWAELTFPLGSLLVFLLIVSIIITWAIISMLKDDDMLSRFLDD